MIPAQHQAQAVLKANGRSFHFASQLLAPVYRARVARLYAFCRYVDDLADESSDPILAMHELNQIKNALRTGQADQPCVRDMIALMQELQMPHEPAQSLVEGVQSDLSGHNITQEADLIRYAYQVAGTVGLMMCFVLDVHNQRAWPFAIDLGIAMQLTNIARDVGEDARANRLYLPLHWLEEVGIKAEAFLANPTADPRVFQLTARLLRHAEQLYARSEAGIPALPLACRPGIFAARHVYAGIGGAVARGGYDSITRRARTTARQKLGWLGLSIARSAASIALPVPATLHAPPAPEVAFLVDAAARASQRQHRSEALLSVFAQLEAKDRAQRVLERARG